MKLLSNKEDLIQWFNLSKGYTAKYDELPKSIQEVREANEGKIRPAHCDRGVLKELFVHELKRLQPSFKLDEYCEPVIKEMIAYCCGESELAYKKGLLLMGCVGSGKTLLMRGFDRFLRLFICLPAHYEPGFNEVAAYSLVDGFAQCGYEIFTTGIKSTTIGIENNRYSGYSVNLLNSDLLIDDLGTEETVTHFGNSCNVCAVLLMRRYETLKYRTHATTNLDAKALRAFYGDRVYSRMREMFNTIHLKGNDRR